LNQNPVDLAATLAKALEDAWNAADAKAFSARFAPFADFVNTQAEYHRGRQAIFYGHVFIFDTIFKGSKVHYDVINVRMLAPGLMSAQVAATLNVPAGPMAGENHATLSFIAREKDGDWLIEVFHNTLAHKETP
jgi:uncharacterized protein (TIGR02246 family)